MGVVEVTARFLGLNPAGALHEHACNDLKAVCNPVLDLLHEDGLFSSEVIFLSSVGPRMGHVSYCQQEANMIVSPSSSVRALTTNCLVF